MTGQRTMQRCLSPVSNIMNHYPQSPRADLSARVSLKYSLSRSAGQKRAHYQAKDQEEEDEEEEEDLDSKRRKKGTGSDGSEEDATEPPNAEAYDWGEDYMSVYGGTERARSFEL
jgi:hypothetical protein